MNHVERTLLKDLFAKQHMQVLVSLAILVYVFDDYKVLNHIQTRMVKAALKFNENMFLCALTDADKINVALLCILHEIGKHVMFYDTINVNKFKMIYTALMRSLVQDVVELNDDHQLSHEQINET
ncbi:unnamed protein product [Rotaria sp. Silwood1]|nr:unnamed protein product [Rotaria sp. Silwood1]